jgi:hypothetical protein
MSHTLEDILDGKEIRGGRITDWSKRNTLAKELIIYCERKGISLDEIPVIVCK